MYNDAIGKLAVRRSQYTGEGYEQSRHGLTQSEGLAPIPEAAADQREFEASCFAQLLTSTRAFSEFPFGIRRVRPGASTITLEAESPERAGSLLRELLPVLGPDGELSGIEGLRIRRRSDMGIELHVIDRPTSLWLTGVTPATWRAIEDEHLHRITGMGWRALWAGPSIWTPEELAWDAQWNTGEWQQQHTAGAWCASGLLRRLALLWTTTTAEVVSGYEGMPTGGYEGRGPVRWCLELVHGPGVAHHQHNLLAALTDADFGLPLRPARHPNQLIPLPASIIRLDDHNATGLLELRYVDFDYVGEDDDPARIALFSRIRRRIAQAPRPSGGQWSQR